MKKILFLLCTLLTGFICQAQFETGKKVIGGQLGFSFSNNNPTNAITTGVGSNYSNFNGSLSLSRFKSPTLLTGYGFNYYYYYNHYNIGTPSSEEIDYNHSFNFFISRTRLHPIAKKLYLGYTGTASVGYAFGKNRFVNGVTNNTDIKTYSANLSGGIGIFYQLKQRLLLNGSLSNLLNLEYSHSDNSNLFGGGFFPITTKSTSNSFSLSTGLQGFSIYNITIGLRYILK